VCATRKNVSANGRACVAVQRQPDSPETGHRIENLVRETHTRDDRHDTPSLSVDGSATLFSVRDASRCARDGRFRVVLVLLRNH
jgi:hypothetical protein